MANKVYDYEEDNSGDLVFKAGDLSVTESTRQHTKALVNAHPGSFSQYPQAGVGIRRYLLDDLSPGELKSKMVEQLELDGQVIEVLKIKSLSEIEIKSNY